MPEQPCKLDASPVEPAFDRSDGNIQRLGNFGVRQALQVVKHDDGAMLDGQHGQRPVNFGRTVGRNRLFLRAGILRGGVGDLLNRMYVAAPPTAKDVERGVHGHTVKPCRKLRVAAKRLERTQRRDERVLRRVARVLRVAAHAEANGPDATFMARHDLIERMAIPRQMALDQIAVVGHDTNIRSMPAATSSRRAGMRATSPTPTSG